MNLSLSLAVCMCLLWNFLVSSSIVFDLVNGEVEKELPEVRFAIVQSNAKQAMLLKCVVYSQSKFE